MTIDAASVRTKIDMPWIQTPWVEARVDLTGGAGGGLQSGRDEGRGLADEFDEAQRLAGDAWDASI